MNSDRNGKNGQVELIKQITTYIVSGKINVTE